MASAVGDSDWRQIVKLIRAAANPGALLARAAPILTEAAQAGHQWAIERLDAELALLAAATMRHIDRHLETRDPVRVALAGGVWTSGLAVPPLHRRTESARSAERAGRTVQAQPA